METNQVAFIQGFVEKCASKGWTADQTSRALAVLQLQEQMQDPDFAAGFNKRAGLQAALDWAGDTSKPMNQAIVGAGIGGLGGLLFGGKNRIRNSLLGAAGGGLAGYGIGRGMGALRNRDAVAVPSATEDFKNRVDRDSVAADAQADFGKKIEAPSMSSAEVKPEPSNPADFSTGVNPDNESVRLGIKSISDRATAGYAAKQKEESGERGHLRAVMSDPKASNADQIKAHAALLALQGGKIEAPSVAAGLGAGAAEGFQTNLVSPAAAVGAALGKTGEGIADGVQGTVGAIGDSAGEGWQGWTDARAAQKQQEFDQILATGKATNAFGIPVDAQERLAKLGKALENYKRKSIQAGRQPGTEVR